MRASTLCDWVREVSRCGHYVGFHVLQTGIIPAELELYEGYWISQFPGLLNIRLNTLPPAEPTDVARNVILAIRTGLAMQGIEDAEEPLA